MSTNQGDSVQTKSEKQEENVEPRKTLTPVNAPKPPKLSRPLRARSQRMPVSMRSINPDS